MSTWLYFECLNHNPPIRSHNEVGQHLYDLPRIRGWAATREWPVDAPEGMDDWAFTAGVFFRDHPTCRIGIVDEYDRRHPIEPESNTVHVIPVNDAIHHADNDCPCGPTVEPVMRDDGSNGWLVTHHSLDGRENMEDDR